MPGKNLIDLKNRRFGKLLVVGRGANRNGRATWFVQCDCGSPPVLVQGNNLRRGGTRSCGCLRAEALARYRPGCCPTCRRPWGRQEA